MSTLSRATNTTRERRARDFYPTIDPRAVAKLVPHLPPGAVIAEPCAGDGELMHHLASAGFPCLWGADIEPLRRHIAKQDALLLNESLCFGATVFVTNPPWLRAWLHRLIRHLASLRPTWLLFDAAWKETDQSAAFADICVKIVSVGRLKWIEGSAHNSTDDCSWYLFDANRPEAERGQTHYVWPAPIRDPAQLVLI